MSFEQLVFQTILLTLQLALTTYKICNQSYFIYNTLKTAYEKQ